MSSAAPMLVWAKFRAVELRSGLAAQGRRISHAEALELTARLCGARDWNVLSARLRRDGHPRAGQRVRGSYLGQPFHACILRSATEPGKGLRMTLVFDTAIETVRFAGLTNLRRRVEAIVDHTGRSRATTSDGVPHMVLVPGV